MPQDADGSGVISLICAAWIYWSVYRWLDYLSSLAQHDKKHRQHSELSLIPGTDARPPVADAKAPRNLDVIVSEILRRDGASTLSDFLANALVAYETVVAAFDAGDLKTLRALVSADVYDAFSDAIAARDEQEKDAETVFSRIEPPEIVDGFVDGTHMTISVRFVGESFTLLRNRSGQIVDEQARSCRTVDIWTFERMLSSRSTTWRVVATQAGV